MKTAELYAQGFLSIPDAAVQVRECSGDPSSSAGGRTIQVSLARGLSFEVLIERGLDVGSVWVEGRQVSWRAPLGAPGLAPSPSDWLGRFGGGMLVTCGLDNIGSPRNGYGQHGSHHDTRAYDVRWERLPAEGGLQPGIRICGTIDSVETFGRTVRVHRELESRCEEASLTVRDRIVNDGFGSVPVPMIYHVNIGAPFVLPGSVVDVNSAEHTISPSTPERFEWRTYPQPIEELVENVWYHHDFPREQPMARARVTTGNRMVEVAWRHEELPGCVQWVFPVRGRWVLGLEPANAAPFNLHGGSEPVFPMLGPGEQKSHEVRIGLC